MDLLYYPFHSFLSSCFFLQSYVPFQMRRLAEEDQKNIVFASFFVLGWQRERERERQRERERRNAFLYLWGVNV